MGSLGNKQRAVAATILYSDLFSYPLTVEEIVRYLEGLESTSRNEVEKILVSLTPYIQERDGFYFSHGREQILKKRLQGDTLRAKKIAQANKAARILSAIPTVRFIGLSGSLAAGTTEKKDDIDFFIITKKQTLFTTRFLAIVLLELFGMRRRRTTRQESDKICLNFFLDESQLRFTSERHDLYTAREIVQVIPLFDRKQVYRKFLTANRWVQRILPHANPRKPFVSQSEVSGMTRATEWVLSLFIIEQVSRFMQYFFIKKHQTTEEVSPQKAAFHPHDYRQETMHLYYQKLSKFEAVFLKNEAKIVKNSVDKDKNIFYTA